MLLRLSSSLLDKFLQAFKLNLIFTRVILLSVLVNCSVLISIFSITFLSSCIVKLFRPLTPNLSKKKMCFWFNSEYAPLVRTFFVRAVSICYQEDILSFFFRYHQLEVYEFRHLLSRKSIHKIVIYVRVINIFKTLYLKVTNSLAHFF